MSDDYENVRVTFKHATPRAVLIEYDGDEHWIPRSSIHGSDERDIEHFDRDDEINIRVRAWKVKELGL